MERILQAFIITLLCCFSITSFAQSSDMKPGMNNNMMDNDANKMMVVKMNPDSVDMQEMDKMSRDMMMAHSMMMTRMMMMMGMKMYMMGKVMSMSSDPVLMERGKKMMQMSMQMYMMVKELMRENNMNMKDMMMDKQMMDRMMMMDKM